MSRDVAREVRRLERATALPLPDDVYTLLFDEPETGVSASAQVLAHVHRVPKHSLWLWYWWTDEELTLVALTEVPPA